MNLEVKRKWKTKVSTIGELYVNGEFLAFTLEDPIRAKKVDGDTAIPAGNYRVQLTYSERFKKILPILLDVPGFSGIRIHAGNTNKDTLGCLLVGKVRKPDCIEQSQKALFELMQILKDVEEPIEIKIG